MNWAMQHTASTAHVGTARFEICVLVVLIPWRRTSIRRRDSRGSLFRPAGSSVRVLGG